MASWGNYAITAVHYDTGHSFIVSCKVLTYRSGMLDSLEVMSRQTIIQNIKSGKTYVTAFFSKTIQKWELGAEVGIVSINGVDYLRTDKNRTTKDNLENLPEF